MIFSTRKFLITVLRVAQARCPAKGIKLNEITKNQLVFTHPYYKAIKDINLLTIPYPTVLRVKQGTLYVTKLFTDPKLTSQVTCPNEVPLHTQIKVTLPELVFDLFIYLLSRRGKQASFVDISTHFKIQLEYLQISDVGLFAKYYPYGLHKVTEQTLEVEIIDSAKHLVLKNTNEYVKQVHHTLPPLLDTNDVTALLFAGLILTDKCTDLTSRGINNSSKLTVDHRIKLESRVTANDNHAVKPAISCKTKDTFNDSHAVQSPLNLKTKLASENLQAITSPTAPKRKCVVTNSHGTKSPTSVKVSTLYSPIHSKTKHAVSIQGKKPPIIMDFKFPTNYFPSPNCKPKAIKPHHPAIEGHLVLKTKVSPINSQTAKLRAEATPKDSQATPTPIPLLSKANKFLTTLRTKPPTFYSPETKSERLSKPITTSIFKAMNNPITMKTNSDNSQIVKSLMSTFLIKPSHITRPPDGLIKCLRSIVWKIKDESDAKHVALTIFRECSKIAIDVDGNTIQIAYTPTESSKWSSTWADVSSCPVVFVWDTKGPVKEHLISPLKQILECPRIAKVMHDTNADVYRLQLLNIKLKGDIIDTQQLFQQWILLSRKFVGKHMGGDDLYKYPFLPSQATFNRAQNYKASLNEMLNAAGALLNPHKPSPPGVDCKKITPPGRPSGAKEIEKTSADVDQLLLAEKSMKFKIKQLEDVLAAFELINPATK